MRLDIPGVATRGRRWTLIPSLLAVSFSATTSGSPQQDYMLHCMGCHGTQAQGVPGKVPPLANALGRFMRSPQGRNYVLRVPGAANSALTDAQLAGVLNWVAITFDDSASRTDAVPFTVAEVTRFRHTPLASVLAARNIVVKNLAASGPAPSEHY